MKFSFKNSLGALVAATAVAAVLLTASDKPTTRPIGEVLFISFSILFWGWAGYIPLIAIHYWLFKKEGLQTLGYSVLMGAGIALVIWSLGVAFGQIDDARTRKYMVCLAYMFAGATYGLVYFYLYRRDRLKTS